MEDQEPLLEQTRLEHRRLDIETRIEQLESDVRSLKSDHVMLEEGAKKQGFGSVFIFYGSGSGSRGSG